MVCPQSGLTLAPPHFGPKAPPAPMFLLQKVFQLRDKSNPDMEKPFLEHLEDLRVMITRVVLTLIIATIGCFVFQAQVMDILRKPVEDVWAEHTQGLLPKGLDVADWEHAKEILDHSVYVRPGEHDAYLGLFTPEKQELVEIIRALRLGKPLDEVQRAAFLKSAAESRPGISDLLAELVEREVEADTIPGTNLTMMSSLKPTETFMLSMKLAFFAGVVVSFPFLLLFVLQFILPGLHNHERKILWPSMAVGFGLFLLGVLFAYYIVLPRALVFFFNWDQGLGVASEWRIGWYIGFATQFTLVFGLSFELPVVIMALVKIGLLTYDMMARTRRYAILAIVVLAAMITPTGDIPTLSLMAVPMYILYEICILLAWFDNKKKREEEETEEKERMERLLDDSEHPPADTEEGEQEDIGDDLDGEPLYEEESRDDHEPPDSTPEEERHRGDEDGHDDHDGNQDDSRPS